MRSRETLWQGGNPNQIQKEENKMQISLDAKDQKKMKEIIKTCIYSLGVESHKKMVFIVFIQSN